MQAIILKLDSKDPLQPIGLPYLGNSINAQVSLWKRASISYFIALYHSGVLKASEIKEGTAKGVS